MTPPAVDVLCIGAGPAGLTAAYLLTRAGARVTVLERDPVHVGGISRTQSYKGFHVDIGGHRFFSKSREVEALWDEILGEDFLERPRKSRIYYRRRLIDYPLRAGDALVKIGPFEAMRCVASYARARMFPVAEPRNFEEWVVNQFGRRLFEIFFRTYTEKVWGVPCTAISADWAAQRIKGLSLSRAVWHALRPQRGRGPADRTIKTLIDRFRYPRRGPGMMWEAAARKTVAAGGAVLMGHEVREVAYDAAAKRWSVAAHGPEGVARRFTADHVISSAPLRELVASLRPALPAAARDAAAALQYRDFLVVALVVRDRSAFDDNWIYVHDPDVKVGRIQNFKSWSPEMVPDPGLNCYGMEYFCFEDDGLWSMADDGLLRIAGDELVALGLAERRDIVDGTVIRQPKAYPVYDDDYRRHVDAVRAALDAHCPNLHPVGRNGMHKYNNQDHAMMTAALTARNILAGHRVYDVWRVNQDAEYHETVEADQAAAGMGGRMTPARVGDVAQP